MEQDQIPAEQGQERNIGKGRGAGLDFDGTVGLDDAMPSLEEQERLIFVLPGPLGLPEVGRREPDDAAVWKLELPAAGPARVEDRDVGVGTGDADGDAGLPESLSLEGPVMAVGFGVGQAASLKAQRRHDVVTRMQLVRALARGWLDPEQFLAGNLGNRPHAGQSKQPEGGVGT